MTPCRRGSVALLSSLLLLLACGPKVGPLELEEAAPAIALPEQQNATAPRHLLVISVAGLTSQRYRPLKRATFVMPVVAALAEAGLSADAVGSVAPATRYPAHATLVTGRVPARHGIVADRRLGKRGIGMESFSNASQLRPPSLWAEVTASGRSVAALAWPSTIGAKLDFILPDREPLRTETWLEAQIGYATPRLLAIAQQEGAEDPRMRLAGSPRDHVMVSVACRLFEAEAPPDLLLLHLSQTAPAIAIGGVNTPVTDAAFRSVDAEIARLIRCIRSRDLLASTSIVVVGDHGVASVHSVVYPNIAMAAAGLLTPEQVGSNIVHWNALVRSNGGSAFVYAREAEDAMLARQVLDEVAVRTGAFRIVSAEEMLRQGADPSAWFGLEGEPGFIFGDAARGILVEPFSGRGGWGYLPENPAMDTGFVAWGPGFRRGVRLPRLRLVDIAPTLAPLLGVSLKGVDGRILVGVLRLPRVGAARSEND